MRYLTAVLEDCERDGIRLAANGGGLEVRGPSTPELRQELRLHKPNILTYLRTGRCHHELEPDACKLCNGRVRRLIEDAEADPPQGAPTVGGKGTRPPGSAPRSRMPGQ